MTDHDAAITVSEFAMSTWATHKGSQAGNRRRVSYSTPGEAEIARDRQRRKKERRGYAFTGAGRT